MALYEYSVSLKDGVAGPAKTMKTEVRGLHDEMKGGLQQAMAGAADAMKVGKESIGAAMTGIKDAFVSLGNGDVQGAIGGVTDAVAGIARSLDLLVPGLGEAAAALAQFAGGALGAVVAGAKLALQVDEADNKMRVMFAALGEGKVGGQQIVGMLDDLSTQIGITKAQLAPFAKEFASMGVTNLDALKKMTTAAISAKAIMGDDSASAAYTTMERKIQAAADSGQTLKVKLAELSKMGVNVNDVAGKMGISASELGSQLKSGSVNAAKFGDALSSALIEKGAGPLSAMADELGNQWAMLQQYGSALFKGLQSAIDPFLEQVKSLFAIFESKTTPSGMALKRGIGAFFTQVFAAATKVVPMVKHFLLDLIIWGLKAYIALRPIVTEFFQKLSAEGSKALALGKKLATALQPVLTWIEGLASNQTVVDAFWSALKGIGSVVAAVAIVIGVLVVAAIGLTAVLVAVQVAIVGVVGYLLNLVFKAGAIFNDWIASAASMAMDFVKGLVSGISNGAGMVIDAVKGLADGAKNAFKGALGIHSPSKVMMELGGHAASGVAEGMSAGVPDVHGAAGELAGASTAGFEMGGGGQGAPPPASAGPSFTIDVGGIYIDGAGKGAEELTEQAVSLIFERVALSQGL